MANIKVEIISRDSIKPSPPTPPHLNKFQLSLIDQVIVKPHMPMIFFYQNDQTAISYMERSILLKESLSETLPLFYPLAGRLEVTSILCNDEGVEYYEAKVSIEVSRVVERPNLEDLRRLMPFDPAHADGRLMVGVQVNYFSCGGMAICVCISHSIVDATLYLAFVKAWATTMSRKVEAKKKNSLDLDHHGIVLPQPVLSGAFYFPPRDISSLPPRQMIFFKEKIVAKRLVFDIEVLDELKKQASIDVGRKVVVPTRVEVVIAFIWQRIMRAARRSHKPFLPVYSFISIVVSLRGRMVPPIPEHALGNFVCRGFSHCAIREDLPCSHLIAKVRKAITEIDSNFIKKIQSGHEFLAHLKNNEPDQLMIGSIFTSSGFTSLCRFPLYEVNFGWGKPVWVCVHASPFKNAVTLSSTKCGNGIEAWITAAEDEMAILNHDPKLFSVAPFRANL